MTLNPCISVQRYSIPRIEELFSKLAGRKRFSVIDLALAYLQVEVREEDRPLLTINTRRGLYRYTRLQFGLSSAPAIWQRTIDYILQGIPMTAVYLEDIIISMCTDQEHIRTFEKVFERLREFWINVKEKKMYIFAT
ncbi:Retrovirus-related Pol polyprotein [Thelohanellus kitauei]|uniref:Retrovirus-related Pol polyprotein n=1 Tax=Thelohanellus kitauei TaxID=669202 RepID=A0A0C2MCB7_THEKT|nr:Retrovirus-related Pol polyprotein [Thelohanellus kitauei]